MSYAQEESSFQLSKYSWLHELLLCIHTYINIFSCFFHLKGLYGQTSLVYSDLLGPANLTFTVIRKLNTLSLPEVKQNK